MGNKSFSSNKWLLWFRQWPHTVPGHAIDNITNRSLVYVALLGIPLNLIIYFALQESEYQLPRYLPVALWLLIVYTTLFRQRLRLVVKKWTFIGVYYLVAVFCLMLGLLDMASLWFLLVTVYVLLVSNKLKAAIVLFSSMLLTILAGLMMMKGNSFIPLDYNFENCQFACVATRVLHFALTGLTMFDITNAILSQLQKHILELKQEMEQKKAIQQKLVEAVVETEEKERSRIASDLHDGLGPILSTINLYFQAYNDSEDPVHQQRIAHKLDRAIQEAIGSVSRISHNISPHIIDKQGLINAFQVLLDDICATGQIIAQFEHNLPQRLNAFEELTLYRIISELINNSLKYAQASHIELIIKIEGQNLIVRYADDGQGFDLPATTKNTTGMGLKNIKNRVNALQGHITLTSVNNQGMSATISIPYQQSNKQVE